MTGSITTDNNGMPIMENPPPNAPFMKQIRNTPANTMRIVAGVTSKCSPPQKAPSQTKFATYHQVVGSFE